MDHPAKGFYIFDNAYRTEKTYCNRVFPAKKLSHDPRTNATLRHHVLESGLQKAVKKAVDKAGITKGVGCRTFRHPSATRMLENGVNIRMVQELMVHADVNNTETYTHVMEKAITAVQSPLDHLLGKTGRL
ncbi:MAG: tyrosine-type recombinase/integrase [Desulfobacterales bacterium]